MSTFVFSLHHLTLSDLRSRVVRKIRNDQIDDDVDGWINDVVQWLTAEFPQESLLSDGEDLLTGTGATRFFDLPDDFQHMLVVYDETDNSPLDGVSPQAMIEEWETYPLVTEDPQCYTIVGRKNAVGSTNPTGIVQPKRIKFDTIVPSAKVLRYTYYKLHHKLVNDDDPVFLDPEIQAMIVDGVLLEADQFSNHEDYERHERKFMRRMDRALTRRARQPSRRVQVGGGYRRGKPYPPRLPSNYPRGW